jgi:hypothetical protein
VPRNAYNLTDDVALLVHLLCRRLPQLGHINPGQILHGVSQARSRSRYGVYAQCHGLRFKNGSREHRTRDGWAWVWPEIRVRGQEMLYYITYFLPRFLDQPPQERLHTLLHELYHIHPRFNGDLRRFSGRSEFHGSRQEDFDGVVDRMLQDAQPHIDTGQFPFLTFNFDELTARHGAVVGNRLRRFQPRRMRIADMPPCVAVPAALAAGRQRNLFPGRAD